MPTVNILEAKIHLSRLVEQVESGAESEIVIARNGRPVARLVPLEAQPAQRRIGVAKGRFRVAGLIDDSNSEVERLFYGESNP
ncbi:MAG: type II toxin-antitoxin system Phd/YefM family antitoxin [Bdellovibrio bacteriovorus]